MILALRMLKLIRYMWSLSFSGLTVTTTSAGETSNDLLAYQVVSGLCQSERLTLQWGKKARLRGKLDFFFFPSLYYHFCGIEGFLQVSSDSLYRKGAGEHLPNREYWDWGQNIKDGAQCAALGLPWVCLFCELQRPWGNQTCASEQQP